LTALETAPPAADCAPSSALGLTPTECCLCQADDAEPVAVGEDFEYRTSADTFLAVRCRRCGLVYLNPRPALAELPRIYPPSYHAFDFSAETFGLVYRVRRRLEARRLLAWCGGLGDDARLIDIGCGDGFHLGLLGEFGRPGWRLEGVDADGGAARPAARTGAVIHCGTLETLDLPQSAYDFAFLIQTVEHVADPPGLLSAVRALLRPGGRVGIVTDNTASPDFTLFKGRHWGGYHFPRHWNLFDPQTLGLLARRAGLEVESLTTMVSPVNWVYSVHNLLVDHRAPRALVDRFNLRSPLSLAAFTALDTLLSAAGRGALLRAVLRRPA
jgi:SAM-dependent methyltransferase